MELVKNVDLSRFSKEFLCGDVMDDRLMRNVAGMELIQEAMKSILLCENRTEGTFRYTVHNISSLSPTFVSSPEYYMRNLRWSVFLRTNYSRPKSLAVFVKCKSDSSSTWSCKVSYELRLLKQKADGPSYTKMSTRIFEPNKSSWGYDPFISWDQLMDPENGYVKDDSIVIEVKLIEVAPNPDVVPMA
ncbi:hypothetical protein CAPTEDRAFT_219914 [Capitella teleta]|uniref:MATH domain-containing protein n=1 Tax=Capitella teleta TaxID=283909 RepID=R7UW42_CAPTE|nr:hypothetical protein CAPTEDRAFT_219914 [Capitella teleta]|eukprot:ELU07571.1 hypothetical protein CAPTEDRAFT_219914 [Capitella teleta]